MRDVLKLSSVEALFRAEKPCFDRYRQWWAEVHYLHHDGVLWKVLNWNKKCVEWDSNHRVMAAWILVFYTLLSMNNGSRNLVKFVKISFVILKGTDLILNKSCFDRCWHDWDICVPKIKTGRWADDFSALNSRYIYIYIYTCNMFFSTYRVWNIGIIRYIST